MKTKIPLTEREMEIWRTLQTIYSEEDQIPTYKVLAERAGIAEVWASRMLTRFRERGLIVKNSIGGWRFRRGQYKVIQVRINRAGMKEIEEEI